MHEQFQINLKNQIPAVLKRPKVIRHFYYLWRYFFNFFQDFTFILSQFTFWLVSHLLNTNAQLLKKCLLKFISFLLPVWIIDWWAVLDFVLEQKFTDCLRVWYCWVKAAWLWLGFEVLEWWCLGYERYGLLLCLLSSTMWYQVLCWCWLFFIWVMRGCGFSIFLMVLRLISLVGFSLVVWSLIFFHFVFLLSEHSQNFILINEIFLKTDFLQFLNLLFLVNFSFWRQLAQRIRLFVIVDWSSRLMLWQWVVELWSGWEVIDTGVTWDWLIIHRRGIKWYGLGAVGIMWIWGHLFIWRLVLYQLVL